MPSPAWIPPFYMFAAGRECVDDPAYDNDVRQSTGAQRILLKLTLSGVGVVYAGGQRYLVPAGHLMTVERPGECRYCHHETAEPWCFEYVSLAIVNPGESLLPPAVHRHPVIDLRPHPDITRRVRELVAMRLADDYQPSLRHSALAYSALLSCIALRLETPATVDPLLDTARRRLAADLAEPLDLAALSAAVGPCRPETLVRRFHAAYGVPPMRYRLLLRLRHACDLLERSNRSVKEIAASCGFERADYFSRQFGRCLGITPTAYRSAPDPLLVARLLRPSEN